MGLSIVEDPPKRAKENDNSFAVLAENEDFGDADAQELPPPVRGEHHKRSRNERRNGVRKKKVSFKCTISPNNANPKIVARSAMTVTLPCKKP